MLVAKSFPHGQAVLSCCFALSHPCNVVGSKRTWSVKANTTSCRGIRWVKKRADTARRAVASRHAHNTCWDCDRQFAIAAGAKSSGRNAWVPWSPGQCVCSALHSGQNLSVKEHMSPWQWHGHGWCSSQLRAEAERVILMPTPSHASGQCALHASSTSAGRQKLLGLICVVLCHLKPVTI
jgi:hypothetical protein